MIELAALVLIVQAAGAPVPCIEGPHEPLRVRRLPGVAATSSRHRDPLEDAYLHCDDLPAGTALRGVGREVPPSPRLPHRDRPPPEGTRR